MKNRETECEKISKTAYARRYGISKARVSQLVKSGKLEVDEKGLIVVKLRVKPLNSSPNSPEDGNLKERQAIAKVVQNECKAELLRIQVSKEQDQVIDLDLACNIAGEAFETLKNSLLLLPLKLAVTLENKEARFIEATLENEIKQCLEEVARKISTLRQLQDQSPHSDP